MAAAAADAAPAAKGAGGGHGPILPQVLIAITVVVLTSRFVGAIARGWDSRVVVGRSWPGSFSARRFSAGSLPEQ